MQLIILRIFGCSEKLLNLFLNKHSLREPFRQFAIFEKLYLWDTVFKTGISHSFRIIFIAILSI